MYWKWGNRVGYACLLEFACEAELRMCLHMQLQQSGLK